MDPDGRIKCKMCEERVETTDLASDFEVVQGVKEWYVLDVCQQCVDEFGEDNAPW